MRGGVAAAHRSASQRRRPPAGERPRACRRAAASDSGFGQRFGQTIIDETQIIDPRQRGIGLDARRFAVDRGDDPDREPRGKTPPWPEVTILSPILIVLPAST